MRSPAIVVFCLALAACVTTPNELASDPSTPRLQLHFDQDWQAVYRAIDAGASGCSAPGSIHSTIAANSGTITSSMWQAIEYQIEVAPAAAGTDVVVLMPRHEAKQRRGWPLLIPRWVQGDLAICPKDVI